MGNTSIVPGYKVIGYSPSTAQKYSQQYAREHGGVAGWELGVQTQPEQWAVYVKVESPAPAVTQQQREEASYAFTHEESALSFPTQRQEQIQSGIITPTPVKEPSPTISVDIGDKIVTMPVSESMAAKIQEAQPYAEHEALRKYQIEKKIVTPSKPPQALVITPAKPPQTLVITPVKSEPFTTTTTTTSTTTTPKFETITMTTPEIPELKTTTPTTSKLIELDFNEFSGLKENTIGMTTIGKDISVNKDIPNPIKEFVIEHEVLHNIYPEKSELGILVEGVFGKNPEYNITPDNKILIPTTTTQGLGLDLREDLNIKTPNIIPSIIPNNDQIDIFKDTKDILKNISYSRTTTKITGLPKQPEFGSGIVSQFIPEVYMEEGEFISKPAPVTKYEKAGVEFATSFDIELIGGYGASFLPSTIQKGIGVVGLGLTAKDVSKSIKEGTFIEKIPSYAGGILGGITGSKIGVYEQNLKIPKELETFNVKEAKIEEFFPEGSNVGKRQLTAELVEGELKPISSKDMYGGKYEVQKIIAGKEGVAAITESGTFRQKLISSPKEFLFDKSFYEPEKFAGVLDIYPEYNLLPMTEISISRPETSVTLSPTKPTNLGVLIREIYNYKTSQPIEDVFTTTGRSLKSELFTGLPQTSTGISSNLKIPLVDIGIGGILKRISGYGTEESFAKENEKIISDLGLVEEPKTEPKTSPMSGFISITKPKPSKKTATSTSTWNPQNLVPAKYIEPEITIYKTPKVEQVEMPTPRNIPTISFTTPVSKQKTVMEEMKISLPKEIMTPITQQPTKQKEIQIPITKPVEIFKPITGQTVGEIFKPIQITKPTTTTKRATKQAFSLGFKSLFKQSTQPPKPPTFIGFGREPTKPLKYPTYKSLFKKERTTRKKKKSSFDIVPSADWLSLTITEARTGRKGHHPASTPKIKKMFEEEFLAHPSVLTFPTAEMFSEFGRKKKKKGKKKRYSLF